MARWLALQPDLDQAIHQVLVAYLAGRERRDSELDDLRQQVRVLCAVLDRVTASTAAAPRPVGMSRQTEPEPIRPIAPAAFQRVEVGQREAAAAIQQEPETSLDSQVNEKIGKLLDFGDI